MATLPQCDTNSQEPNIGTILAGKKWTPILASMRNSQALETPWNSHEPKFHTRTKSLIQTRIQTVPYSHKISDTYSHRVELPYSHGFVGSILAWNFWQEKLAWHTRMEMSHTRMQCSILACNVPYSHIFTETRIFSKNRLRNSQKYVKTWKISYLKPLCDPSSKSIKSHIK